MIRLARLLATLGLLALAGGGRAFAAERGEFDIDVTIQANLTVEIDGATSSTHTTSWDASIANQKLASVSTVTVRSDTGGLTTRWALSAGATTINTAAGPDVWTLTTSSGSVGADQVAVQAVFGSSRTAIGGCPSATSPDWDMPYAPPLTTAPVQYKTTVFADPNLINDGTPNPDNTTGGSNGLIHAGSRRALCWRLVMPSATSTVQTQNVQITITAVVP